MEWFIGAIMAILSVASIIIGAISVAATGNIILFIVWLVGLLLGFANIGYAFSSLYKRLD